MKKLLPIILAVIVVVGAAVFFLLNRTPAGVKDGDNLSSTEPDKGDVFTGSLMDALKLGTSMKCTYDVDGNEYVGYVKGKNYRGMITTQEGKTMEVIVKDNCMWSWSQDEDKGMKTCFEATDPETGEGGIWEKSDASADINYRCLTAAVSDAQFTPPSNIEFVDLNSMMENLKNQTGY